MPRGLVLVRGSQAGVVVEGTLGNCRSSMGEMSIAQGRPTVAYVLLIRERDVVPGRSWSEQGLHESTLLVCVLLYEEC